MTHKIEHVLDQKMGQLDGGVCMGHCVVVTVQLAQQGADLHVSLAFVLQLLHLFIREVVDIGREALVNHLQA